MRRCQESDRIQDYLDGELPVESATRMRAHLATCESCAAELAVYRRVFESLAHIPLLEPAPALGERILSRVLPSHIRRRQRRNAALVGAYAGLVALSLTGIFAGVTQPAGRRVIENVFGELSHALIGYGLFVLNAASASILRLADLWNLIDLTTMRFAPLARAFTALISQPVLVLTALASMTACAALLWWMRPRPAGTNQGARHVGMLGF
jgi:hypothetical protein